MSAANELPRLGDALIDSAGDCFTILVVEELPAATRLRCTTPQPVARVSTERPRRGAAGDLGRHGRRPDNHRLDDGSHNCAAHIQPGRLEIDASTTPPTTTATYRIILVEQLTLTTDTRFIDPQGNIYRLVEYTAAQRIDALPVATVIKEPSQ